MHKQKSYVDQWLERETPDVQRALKNAAEHFDSDDALDVHVLEGVYGQESRFGQNLRRREMKGAAGHFHMEAETAREMGITVNKSGDQRFDLDESSGAAARYLNVLDHNFRKDSTVFGNLKTTGISNPDERLKFTLGAYNGGAKAIAEAQQRALEDGKNPTKWDEVKNYLGDSKKAKEIRGYVEKVLKYSKEFSKKSKIIAKRKRKPKKGSNTPIGWHWITIHGRHILVRDK